MAVFHENCGQEPEGIDQMNISIWRLTLSTGLVGYTVDLTASVVWSFLLMRHSTYNNIYHYAIVIVTCIYEYRRRLES
jgi:hypothetical protein